MQLPNIKDARIRTKEKIEVSYDKYKVPESIHNIGHNKTYTILTYGCQMNVHDSENISGIMEDLGYTKEENYEKNCISWVMRCIFWLADGTISIQENGWICNQRCDRG